MNHLARTRLTSSRRSTTATPRREWKFGVFRHDEQSSRKFFAAHAPAASCIALRTDKLFNFWNELWTLSNLIVAHSYFKYASTSVLVQHLAWLVSVLEAQEKCVMLSLLCDIITSMHRVSRPVTGPKQAQGILVSGLLVTNATARAYAYLWYSRRTRLNHTINFYKIRILK